MMKIIIFFLLFHLIHANVEISEILFEEQGDRIGLEVYNSNNFPAPDGTHVFYGYFSATIPAFKPHFVPITSMPAKIHWYQPIQFPIFYDVLVIIIYQEPDPSSPSTYDDIQSANIVDSLVLTRTSSGINYASDILPEWNGKLIHSKNVSRCSSELRNPASFIERPISPNGPNNCPQNGVHGDPHFFQTINDKNTNQTINICYDVTGKNQQSIFILEDRICQTKVEGVLLNDYYMHKIIIFHKETIMKINVTNFSFKDHELIWSDHQNKDSWTYFEDVEITFNTNEMRIDVFHENTVGLSILITKSKNNYGLEHLDINFDKIDYKKSSKTRYGGLIGDIQRQGISVTRGIQYDKRVSISINDKIFAGRIIKKSEKECILVPFKEVIKPKTQDDYVRFKYQ